MSTTYKFCPQFNESCQTTYKHGLVNTELSEPCQTTQKFCLELSQCDSVLSDNTVQFLQHEPVRDTPCPQLSESCQTTLRYKYCQQHTSPVNNDMVNRYKSCSRLSRESFRPTSKSVLSLSTKTTGEEEEISQPELCQLSQRFCRSDTFIPYKSTHTPVGPVSSRRRSDNEASRCDLGSFRYRQCRHAGLQRSPRRNGSAAVGG